MNSSMTGAQDAPTNTPNSEPSRSQTSSNGSATSHSPASPHRSEADKARAVADLLNGGGAAAGTDDSGDATRDGDTHDDDIDGRERDPAVGAPAGDASASAEGGGVDDGGVTSPPASAPPRTLRELAERAGVELSSLYDIDIPLTDHNGTVKLGALKDAFQSKRDAEREIAQRAASLDEREIAIINEQRMWAQLGTELSQRLPPQTVNALRQRMAAQQDMERQQLMLAMPELRDQTKFDTFRDQVVETLGKFGFAPHEIVVGDHRQLLVVRALIRAQQQLKALRDFKPTPKPQNGAETTGRRVPTSDAQRMVQRAGRRGATESDRVAGVAALINGRG